MHFSVVFQAITTFVCCFVACSVVRVQFNQTEYVVGEEDQFVGVVIRKTGNTQQDIDFLLVISDGTARGGQHTYVYSCIQFVVDLGILRMSCTWATRYWLFTSVSILYMVI